MGLSKTVKNNRIEVKKLSSIKHVISLVKQGVTFPIVTHLRNETHM